MFTETRLPVNQPGHICTIYMYLWLVSCLILCNRQLMTNIFCLNSNCEIEPRAWAQCNRLLYQTYFVTWCTEKITLIKEISVPLLNPNAPIYDIPLSSSGMPYPWPVTSQKWNSSDQRLWHTESKTQKTPKINKNNNLFIHFGFTHIHRSVLHCILSTFQSIQL